MFCRAVAENNGVYDTAQYIEQELREQLIDEINVASLWQDLLGTAFDRINWVEIVNTNLEDYEE